MAPDPAEKLSDLHSPKKPGGNGGGFNVGEGNTVKPGGMGAEPGLGGSPGGAGQPGSGVPGGPELAESDAGAAGADSNLTQSSPQPGGQPGGDKQEQGAGSRAVETGKDAAKAGKDIAEAGGSGGLNVKKEAQDLQRAKAEGGGAEVAAVAGEKAAGHAVAAGAAIATVGASSESYGLIQKTTEKTIHFVRKHPLEVVIAAVIIPTMLFYAAYTIFDAFKHPAKVLQDPKKREFVLGAAKSLGPALLKASGISIPGVSQNIGGNGINLAATITTKPKPGSYVDKLTQINFKQIQFQTLNPDCPYHYTTHEITNINGKPQQVIDKILNNRNQEVSGDQVNDTVLYCIINQTPLYNLSVRTPEAREVNSFAGVHLNFAEPIGANAPAAQDVTPSEQAYNKTYQRITPTTTEVPQYPGNAALKKQGADEYIKKVRIALETGEDPYAVDSDFSFTGDAATDETVKTLDGFCAFSFAYLSPANLRAMVTSRLNASSRSGVKTLTLSDTRQGGGVSAAEYNANYNLIQNWNAGRVYSQNVYGTQAGEAINPESVGNSAYNGDLVPMMNTMFDTNQACFLWQSTLETGGDSKKLIEFLKTKAQSTIKVVNDYNIIRQIIVDNSNGKFTAASDFGLQQLMVSLIRAGGASAVSGLEPGPQNYNNQSQGFRELMNRYCMRTGCRFLTLEEEVLQANKSENLRRDVEQKQGIAYRLFSPDNTRSLASTLQASSPKTMSEFGQSMGELFKTNSNPLKMIADVSSQLGYIGTGSTNQAFAAGATGDSYLKLNTTGFSPEEQAIDPIANATEVEALKDTPGDTAQKGIMARFDTCFKTDIPSDIYFYKEPQYDGNGNKVADIGRDKFGLPVYTVLRDLHQDEAQVLSAPAEAKVQWIACDILFHKSTIYTPTQQQQLFGISGLEALAVKYRVYTYQNFMVDNLIKLSSTGSDTSIYANPTALVTDNISGGGSSGLETGDTQDLAKQIVASGNITYDYGPNGNIGSQFKDLAAGNNPVPCGTINPQILGMLLALTKDHKVQVSSLARGRDCRPKSWHGSGGAIDISTFDGQGLTGNNQASNKLMEAIINLTPSTTRVGFGNCDGHQLPTQGKPVYFFSDNCNHVHTTLEFATGGGS